MFHVSRITHHGLFHGAPAMEIVTASRAFMIKAPPPVMGISPGSPALPISLNFSIICDDDRRDVATDPREP